MNNEMFENFSRYLADVWQYAIKPNILLISGVIFAIVILGLLIEIRRRYDAEPDSESTDDSERKKMEDLQSRNHPDKNWRSSSYDKDSMLDYSGHPPVTPYAKIIDGYASETKEAKSSSRDDEHYHLGGAMMPFIMLSPVERNFVSAVCVTALFILMRFLWMKNSRRN